MIWHKKLKSKPISKRSLLNNNNNNTANPSSSNNSNSAAAATNNIIMDYSHSEEQLCGAVEIIPQRLYYAPLKFFPPESNQGEDEATAADEDNQHSSSSTGAPSKATATASTANPKKGKKKTIHYFSIDNELIYWNFFLDFGPLNLGQLHRFSSKLNAKLSSPEYKDCIICYYSSAKGEARANAIFMICAWSMLYLGRSLEESYFGFRQEFAVSRQQQQQDSGSGGKKLARMGNSSLPPKVRLTRRQQQQHGQHIEQPSPFARIHPLPPFHDASPIMCTYDLSVYDCLQGLDRARHFGFFRFGNAPNFGTTAATTTSNSSTTSTRDHGSSKKPKRNTTWPPRTPSPFNVDEYEYFEQVENGDLNWIVANKILAFAGPQATKVITPEGFCMLTPGDYIPYFVKQNVKLVVRLNKKCYDENDFRKVGINHVEHYYLDGSCPPMHILHDVVADMESIEDDQAMAVHCKAGLGRTGTCIGAYLMKHYRLTAREVIGWMRICRPGMVIGPQQHFIADIEGLMWQEGDVYRGTGLRRMSLGSQENYDGEGDEDDIEAATKPAAVSPASILRTPAAAATATATATASSPGAHVSIVTPDGKLLHLPTTPVVARRLEVELKSPARHDDDMMVVSPPGAATEEQTMIHSTPSSTSSLPTMDALQVNNPDVMKEGDQANALLSRRLDHARQQQHSK